MTKKIILFVSASFLFLCTKAQNGLDSIIVEKYYVSDAADAAGSIGTLPVGSVTYRVYADMQPGYLFQVLYGVNTLGGEHELRISTSTSFFNNEDRGATSPNGISAANTTHNTVRLDSWFSTGGAAAGKIGVLKTEDTDGSTGNTDGILANNDASAGIPIRTQDGMITGTLQAVTFVGLTTELDVFDATSQVGNLFSTLNGSVASLNGSSGPTAANRVLIGQFTTDGNFAFELNVQIKKVSDGSVENYVAKKPVGDEISIPSLIYPQVTAVVPTITANGATTFCEGGSVTLSSSSASGYLWSPGGATTQSIVVTNSGSYTVTATYSDASTATSLATVVTVNPNPVPTIIASGPTSFCAGGSVTLSSSAANGYLWNPGGATTQSIVVNSGGNYVVTATNAGGCSTTSSATVVTVNANPAIPTISAGGPVSFCTGGSVSLSSSSGTTYLWTPGGATTQSINASASGSYTVRVTNASGCSATSSATVVTANSNPATPTISASGPTTFCTGGSVTLSSSSASTYLWTPGGATTQSINASASGSYTVRVTNASGCSATSLATVVSVNSNPIPTIIASGATTFCTGGSVTLSSSLGIGYSWSPGGATTQSISVNAGGSYTVTVAVSAGCSGTSTATVVTVNPNPGTPTILASGPVSFCTGGSVTLSSSAGTTYLWSPGGATTQTINATASGSYTVRVTNASGCSATSSATVVISNPNPSVPIISASGPTSFCTGGSVTLSSSSATAYLWSPGGATNQSIVVTNGGSYSVRVSNANGCTATSTPTVVTVSSSAIPTITASGSAIFCEGGSVTLSSSSATGYLWSPGGATTQSIVVVSSGSYTVTTSGACGGTSSVTVVTVKPNPIPMITASGPTSFCTGGSVTLSSSPASGYLWNPGGATTQSIVVNSSGSYSVTATNAGGCTAASLVTVVNVNSNPTPTITAGSTTTFCTGGSVILSSSAGINYSWSPGGATTQTISVNSGGSYTVTVTISGGCSGISLPTVVTVNSNPAIPVITAGGSLTFCTGGSVNLSSSAGSTYLWSPGGATTQSINATASGSYTVRVTNAGGCSATSAATVVTANSNPAIPVITANGPTTFCTGGSVTLSSSSASTYLWSPGGASTQSILVTGGGSYTVTISNTNGCTAKSTATIVAVSSSAIPTITAGGSTTFCQGGSVTLSSSSAQGYIWSPGGATTRSILVTSSGSYTVTTSGACGGTSSATVVVVNPLPVVTLAPLASRCITDPAFVLTGGSPAGGVYSGSGVSGGIFNPSITGIGTFTITYTYSNGCSKTATATISVNNCTVGCTSSPAKPLAISGPLSVCQSATSVVYTCSTVPGATSYEWQVVAGTNLVSSSGNTAVINFSGTKPKKSNIKVRSVNACGKSGYEHINVSIDDCKLAEAEEARTYSSVVYPNPVLSGDEINIDITEHGNSKVQMVLTDILGKIILNDTRTLNNGINHISLKTEYLRPGIYFLNMQSGEMPGEMIRVVIN